MKCRVCNCELGEKFVQYKVIKDSATVIEGVCFECAETNYNDYKKSDGKERDFCEKCGEKFLVEDLSEVTIKKVKMLVCSRCNEG